MGQIEMEKYFVPCWDEKGVYGSVWEGLDGLFKA